MLKRSNYIYNKGAVNSRSECGSLLKQPGDYVMVERGIPRLLVLRCPCGCGDDLLINLDERAGPAWRIYSRDKKISLYPSYWRETECESHFIIWNNQIFWFSKNYSDTENWYVDDKVEKQIMEVLQENNFLHYTKIAEQSGLIPWECLQGCIQLEEKGFCKVKEGKVKEYFMRTVSKNSRY